MAQNKRQQETSPTPPPPLPNIEKPNSTIIQRFHKR